MSPSYLLRSQSDTNRLRNAGQFVDPRSFSVIGQNGTFRASSFEGFFNPTSTTPPFFQIFDQEFLKVLGTSASLTEIASNPGFAFAHEAPIYVPETDELFFASNDGGPLGMSDLDHNNEVSKISMAEVEAALARKSSSPINVTLTPVSTLHCEASAFHLIMLSIIAQFIQHNPNDKRGDWAFPLSAAAS